MVIGLAFYLLLIRPQQQRTKKQRAAQSDIAVGDEVLTIGGIVGTVLEMDDERVTILTGGEPGGPDGSGSQPLRIVLVRHAIARKIEPPAETDHAGVEAAELHDDGADEDDEEHGEEHGK